MKRYRITADWPGGGFYMTLPFADEAEARAFAERHCGKDERTVGQREEARISVVEAPALRVDPAIVASDERALREQIQRDGAMGQL